MYPISRHSRRLHLRELRPDDVEGMFAIYGDPRATEHMSFDPRTRQDVEGIVARSIASAAADPRQEYALAVADTDNDGGRLIGFGRLALDPHPPRAAGFGFALNPDVWGNGYGTETVRLLLACAFEDLELHRVWGARSPPQHRLRPHHAPRRATSANTSNAAANGANPSPTPSSTTSTQPLPQNDRSP
ncbi:GCN5-related N-acetyltransferase [Streptomyces globisporus]|uniref:GCN5-related N-acetyltransferase n=1 Tax=Streptomyces globisporus TaxID=1908 RepID=A0ABN8VHF2_STRGL|nr:GNAT family N-acetyltransferase [Streptomyces globisporus]CAH9420374.1 GCN5-related N-acetyltransferase [Streptomyces globisporus]